MENLSQVLRHLWALAVFLEPPVRVGERSWLDFPGIADEVRATVQAVERGDIDSGSAAATLLALVRKCRERD